MRGVGNLRESSSSFLNRFARLRIFPDTKVQARAQSKNICRIQEASALLTRAQLGEVCQACGQRICLSQWQEAVGLPAQGLGLQSLVVAFQNEGLKFSRLPNRSREVPAEVMQHNLALIGVAQASGISELTADSRHPLEGAGGFVPLSPAIFVDAFAEQDPADGRQVVHCLGGFP